MSFLDLKENFDRVKGFISEATKRLSILNTIFKDLKDAEERYSKNLALISQRIREDLLVESESISLQTAYVSLERYLYNQAMLHHSLSQSYSSDLIDTLITFLNNYNATVYENTRDADNILTTFIEGRTVLEKARNRYFQKAAIAERAEQIASLEDEGDRYEKALNNCAKAKNLSNEALEKYLQAFEEETRNWGNYCNVLPKHLIILQQSQESRIQFTKFILSKYIKITNKVMDKSKENRFDLGTTVANVSPKKDIEFVVSTYRQENRLADERFVVYDEWKRIMRLQGLNPIPQDNSYVVTGEEEYTPLDPEIAVIKTVIYNLCPLSPPRYFGDESDADTRSEKSSVDSETLSFDSQVLAKVKELLETSDGRELFIDVLEWRKRACLLNRNSLKQLAGIINTLLTAMNIQEDYNPTIFDKIVTLSHHFYTINPKRRVYLYEYLAANSIWQSKERWISAIEISIFSKRRAERESFYRTVSMSKKKSWTWFTPRNASKRTFSEDKTERSCAGNVLNSYNFYMTNLEVNIKIAEEVVLYHSLKSKIEKERVIALLVELWAVRKHRNEEQFQVPKSTRQRAKERAVWGNFLHIGLCCCYLSVDDLKVCMEVCSTWKLNIEPYYLRKLLTDFKSASNYEEIRRKTWARILTPKSTVSSLPSLLSHIKSNPMIIKPFSDVIDMDVLRSYANEPRVPSDHLKDILKAYTVYNPDVGYCQGMNFITGTLIYCIKDPDLSFLSLVGLIQKFHLENLYAPELPRLKLLFYQLDRLICSELPEIYTLFKTEMMSSGQFASSWFITLFSVVLQNNQELLLEIWSLFILDGWKVLFKAILAVIDGIAPELVNKRFDDILPILASIQHSSNKLQIFNSGFLARVKGMKVTNRTLSKLQAEYREITNIASTVPNID